MHSSFSFYSLVHYPNASYASTIGVRDHWRSPRPSLRSAFTSNILLTLPNLHSTIHDIHRSDSGSQILAWVALRPVDFTPSQPVPATHSIITTRLPPGPRESGLVWSHSYKPWHSFYSLHFFLLSLTWSLSPTPFCPPPPLSPSFTSVFFLPFLSLHLPLPIDFS
ncbi:Centrin-4 [Fusarium oxysporum f. sp. albedinis]|nr:Centrin-4 [Fusarium oxysporum f. sp. albedinis]